MDRLITPLFSSFFGRSWFVFEPVLIYTPIFSACFEIGFWIRWARMSYDCMHGMVMDTGFFALFG